MNGFNVFQYMFDQIETPFLRSVNILVRALVEYASTPVQVALILYIILTGLLMMRGYAGEAFNTLLTRIVVFTVVIWFATNGSVYTTYVQDFFLTVLPNELTHVVANAGGNNPDIAANSFDTALKKAYEAGLKIWKTLGYWDIGEEIVIAIFWLAAIVACIACFAIWFLSHVALGLFIIIGPLMICLILFPPTKPIFERWIGAMISCVILQVSTVILLTLMLQVEGAIIAKIFEYKGDNPFEQLGVLLAGICFFLFSAVIVYQLPALATALAGGLHFHTGAIARSLSQGIRGTGRAAAETTKAAAPVALQGVRTVRTFIRQPPGGSLSHRRTPTP